MVYMLDLIDPETSTPQKITQAYTDTYGDIGGAAEAGDNFGAALAAGLFRADGTYAADDLFVGSPGENSSAGLFHTIFDRANGGLTTQYNDYVWWNRSKPPSSSSSSWASSSKAEPRSKASGQGASPASATSESRSPERARCAVLRQHAGCGMEIGMATTKVTVTIEDEQLAAVRKLVASGKADSVSAFVQHAVAVSLSDVAGWGAMLGLALQATGGPLSAKERAWADSVLKPQRRARSRSKRKAA